MAARIANCKVVIACLSRKYLDSHNTLKEINFSDQLRKPIACARFFHEPDDVVVGYTHNAELNSVFLITTNQLYANFKTYLPDTPEWTVCVETVVKQIKKLVPKFAGPRPVTAAPFSAELYVLDVLEEVACPLPVNALALSILRQNIKETFEFTVDFEVWIKNPKLPRPSELNERKLQLAMSRYKAGTSAEDFQLWLKQGVEAVGPYRGGVRVIEANKISSYLALNSGVETFNDLKKLLRQQLDVTLGDDAILSHNGTKIQNDEDVQNLLRTLGIRSEVDEMWAGLPHETNNGVVSEADAQLTLRNTNEQFESVGEAVFPVSLSSERADYDAYIVQAPKAAAEEDELSFLNPVSFETLDEKFARAYVDKTRMWAVESFDKWSRLGRSTVLCHFGGAGVGKSMLAWRIRSWQAQKPHLASYVVGGYFHCKHDDPEKNNARNVVATLAHQLARRSVGFRKYIVEIKRRYDEKKALDAELVDLVDHPEAFKLLFLDGLKHVERSERKELCFVIDALDEVGIQGEAQRRYFLETIARGSAELPDGVRLFVTSRPEADVVKILGTVQMDEIRLRDGANMDDIGLFVQAKFGELGLSGTEYVRQQQQVAVASEGVFVFAALVCKEMEAAKASGIFEGTGGAERVAEFLHGMVVNAGLEALYAPILERCYLGATEDELLMLRSVVGIVLAGRQALYAEVVAYILQVTLEDVCRVTDKIRSILYVEGGRITVLHKSVKDYFSSRKSCLDGRFFVDERASHNLLAGRCLDALEAVNRAQGVNAVGANLEGYAVEYWGYHIAAGKSGKHIGRLDKFATGGGLYAWIEKSVVGGKGFDIVSALSPVLGYFAEQPDGGVGKYEVKRVQQKYAKAVRIFEEVTPQTMKACKDEYERVEDEAEATDYYDCVVSYE
ncbi:hypothetical protein HDU84_009123 [Entophlyctis sp. JEL0112]|nr:hypothetical protein HDU84_009123 [Entophlyctis sp. JEL0112]